MPGKRERDSDASQSPEASSNSSPISNEVLSLRDDCLSQLNSIAARVQQISVQRSADWTRALQEAQLALQMRQQTLMTDYRNRARQVSAQATSPKELAELSQRCAVDFEGSHREACKSVEDAGERLRTAYESGIADANRDWDAACQAFVGALQQRLEKAGASKPADPIDLARIGQSLAWIASMMRPRSTA